jgi:hypothetical protein
LKRTPITTEIKASIDKWNFIKFKSFCTAMETITRKGKTLPPSSNRGLIFRIYKEFKKLNSEE